MICLSIMKRTTEEALALMEAYAGLCDAIELRLDTIHKPDLDTLCAFRLRPIIATVRKKDEGGHFEGTEKARIALLCEAVERGVEYVDVELSTRPAGARMIEDVRARERGRTQLVVSYHDFEKTPPFARLYAIASRCRQRGADIVKIAVRARAMEDNMKILQLLHRARTEEMAMAAFCMGKKGRLSRIAAPLFGSCITYVAAEGSDASAPGQLTIDEMKTVMEILGQ